MRTKAVSFYYLDAVDRPPRSHAEPHEELLRVAVALNRGSTPEELTDILFETLNDLVPHDRIGLAKVTSPGVLSVQHVRSRFPIVWGKGASAPLAGSSLAPILDERKIRVIEDLAAYERDHPESRTASRMLAEGMRSSLALPVFIGLQPVGVVFFSSARPRAFKPRHVDFVRMLAAAIGIALERVELIASLRQANEELKTLDQLKANFLSNLSHELRTPLSRILGNAYALAEGDVGELSADQHHRVAEIVAGSERLEALLQDLFDYTAFESGRLSLDRVPVDLGAIAAEVADELRPAIEGADLHLSVVLPDGPVMVEGNGPMLARAIGALLDNARKFTPTPGTVTVAVERQGEDAWVEVSDTGVGVDPALHGHLFEKFFQADSGAARAHGGAGLGLALVRAIVLAHGGRVWFDSRPAIGSRFRLVLPACPDLP
ncbi:Alkaline phosphatase synthesis sensor protein PhoR [compost metagenome]